MRVRHEALCNRAGQYRPIPLSNDRFACGRVMAVLAFGPRDRIGVVIGLMMDWTGADHRGPTSSPVGVHAFAAVLAGT
jgi:hypothetical protein